MSAAPKETNGTLRLVSVGAAALIVAVATLLLLSGGDDDDAGTAPAPPPAAAVEAPPEIVAAGDLRALTAEVGHPLYWLGERPGSALELTREGNGDVYVRYMTGGAEAGDPRPRFVTVGTYPVPDAVAATERAATEAGVEPRPIPHGGTAFVNPDNPDSVYFAYAGADYQVEVFAPKPGEALALVTGGKVIPVG